MDDALNDVCESAVGERGIRNEKVLRLYEAFLSFPMRMRMAPSHVQICLDSITYGEDLHVAKMASSDGFFDFAQKVIALFPTHPPFVRLLRREIQATCEKHKVTFHCNSVGVNAVRALLSVAPFAHDTSVTKAMKSFEDVSKRLNDQTSISQLMATTTKHYPNGNDAAVGAFVEMVEALRGAVVFKDITKDAHINKEFLVGGRQKVV